MKSHIENCKQWLRQRSLQIRQRMPNSEIELSDFTLADHHAEDVMIAQAVVPELKFRNVERHIFSAEAVEGTKDATLEYKTRNLQSCVGVNGADSALVGIKLP